MMYDLHEDLAELFATCQPDYESAVYQAHQNRLGRAREDRKLNHAARRAAHRRQKRRERAITAILKAKRAARTLPEIPPLAPLPRRVLRRHRPAMHAHSVVANPLGRARALCLDCRRRMPGEGWCALHGGSLHNATCTCFECVMQRIAQ